MKSCITKLIITLLCLYSTHSAALNVDKMIIFSKQDQQTATLKVTNPADYPVMFKVELSERNDDGQVTPLSSDNFDNWPAFLDRTEYFIDPKGEIEVNIRLIGNMLGDKSSKDTILAIDVTPESINSTTDTSDSSDNMAILMGYRTWLVIPKDGQVKGDVSVIKEGDKYFVVNDMDTVAFLNINACETKFTDSTQCFGTEWVLAGRKKELNFKPFSNGEININFRDSYDRFKKSQILKI